MSFIATRGFLNGSGTGLLVTAGYSSSQEEDLVVDSLIFLTFSQEPKMINLTQEPKMINLRGRLK